MTSDDIPNAYDTSKSNSNGSDLTPSVTRNIDTQQQSEITLELTEAIIRANIISSVTLRPAGMILIISFNGQKYDNKQVLVFFNGCFSNWLKFCKDAQKRLRQKGVGKEDILMIRDLLDHHFKIISNFDSKWVDRKESIARNQINGGAISKFDAGDDGPQFANIQEWESTVVEKYEALKNNAQNTFNGLWPSLEFALSIRSIQSIRDCTLPFIGILLGPPSSVKTLTIELFRGTKFSFYSDSFSARSFVSHNTAVKKDNLEEMDLLPKIKDKFFLTPELSPTFSKKNDEIVDILGIITRIADGHGYESDSGAQGHRGYTGEYMFTWLGAAVDIPRKVHRIMGSLGPKLYFYRIDKKKGIKEDEYLEHLKNSDEFKRKFDHVKMVLMDYLKCFDHLPLSQEGVEEELTVVEYQNCHQRKRKWYTSKDSEQALRYIIKLAHLLSHLRGVVPTWETRDTQGTDYAFDIATIEEPERAMTQLKNLARGHAISRGRNYLSVEDIPMLIKVVLSTASRERVVIFDFLLSHKGQTDTNELKDFLNISGPTANKTMTELVALELVYRIDLGDAETALKQIQLKREFDWFLTDEFRNLRAMYDEKKIFSKEQRYGEVLIDELPFDTAIKALNCNSKTSIMHLHKNCFKEKLPPHSLNFITGIQTLKKGCYALGAVFPEFWLMENQIL